MKKAIIILPFIICLLHCSLFAQTIPVGTPSLDDYYRREQLLGHIDSTFSFTVRPAVSAASLHAKDIFMPDSVSQNNGFDTLGPQSFAGGKGTFQLLPLTWQQQFNSNHPYGWNDGAMIPAKGYQTLLSGGFFIKYGILTIQLRPEFIYAANPKFTGFESNHSDSDLGNYYLLHAGIDMPEYFGTGPYSKIFWGQSSLRFNFGKISAGISTENVWWGPGIQNSLVLSNNAPGFKHLSIRTESPLKTPVGSFEFDLLAGRLDASGYSPLPVTTLSDGTIIYQPVNSGWRYFTGFNLNYHPSIIPNLTIGLTRTFDSYYRDVKGLSSYLPFFTSYQKLNSTGDPFPRDQITSFYARWLFTKAHAEIYFEYGLEDNSYNYRDFILSPQHSRAYIFGFRKFVSYSTAKNSGILFDAEVTQLSQTVDRIVRNSGPWYAHYQVLEGDTYLGQVLGAGTGPGGNLQQVNVSWVNGLKKIGVIFQRYEHDVDFSNYILPEINNNSRNWVDFGLGVTGEYNYKNFLFNVKIQEIKSLNYEWILNGYTPGMTYYIPNNTVYNLHAELGITYRF